MLISAVIPLRNEEDSIRELLDGLLSQTRPPDEIVITDGGSTDSTTRIIEEYIERGAPVKLIRAGAALPGRGRNLAAQASSFEWIAFIDGGIRPEKNWLETLSSRAEQDPSIDVVYGSWEPIVDSFFKECATIAYVSAPTLTNGEYIRPRFIASTLMRRVAWQSVGGFPEDLRSGEDLIFMNNVEAAGYRSVRENSAVVHWNIQPNFSATFKRFLAYSRNNIRAGLWRQWQAPILSRYAFLLLLLLLGLILGAVWLLVPLGLGVAMLVARALVAIRRNRACYPAGAGRNLKRLLLLVPLLALLDVAAILGSIQWLMKDSFRSSRKTVVEAGDGA